MLSLIFMIHNQLEKPYLFMIRHTDFSRKEFRKLLD
jgi:hypothetical protein